MGRIVSGSGRIFSKYQDNKTRAASETERVEGIAAKRELE